MSLPRFLVLKSNYNKKYLRYIQEDVPFHGFLQFSGEEVVTPYAKFEVEMAKSGNGLVHIRCCYNNKYWVREKKNSWWIVARADEPEEDKSNWSCTLFKPIYVDADAKTVRFLHVQLGRYACLWMIAPSFDPCLYASSENPNKDSCDVYTIIDWESLLIMPKHVAFKGDNGQYLSAQWTSGNAYLQFISNDVGDPTVGNEIFTTSDGSIRVKSNHIGKFWSRYKDWIVADSDETTNNNSDTLFWPIKVDNNVVALRNLGNNNFCESLTSHGIKYLYAGVSTISKEARIEVEELVISRRIYNVNFRCLHARIYNQTVIPLTTEVAINKTQEPNNAEVKFSYKDTKNSTWNASVSLKMRVKTSFETSIPFLEKGKFEMLDKFSGACQWGETETSSTEVETVHKVTVPPMTKVTMSLLANMGSYDIPFSYTQHDTLTNGQQVTSDMDDGIYTGISYFNIECETKQEKLM
ncbi:hypothetical protein K1719_040537 [Acacia pycnantha]|nr:hypothetical protein K1719_040537 [Acacia pycnantha]